MNDKMLPDYDFKVGNGELLCLVDYYGQLTADDVEMAIIMSGGRLVVDETQGLFREPWGGADTFWSIRKYRVSDASFASEGPRGMSVIAERLIAAVDKKYVASRRRSNWDELNKAFAAHNQLSLTKPDAPFMYPLLVENAAGVRERLNDEGVFVPLFWHDVLSNPGAGMRAKDFAMNIIPLPLDQRYGRQEMEFVAKKVFLALSLHGGNTC